MLRDVSAQSDPGALLSVFVERKGAPNTRKYVGTINWFGVFDPMSGMEGEHAGPSSRTFQYDVSKQLKALGANTSELTVVFEATSGLVPTTKKRLKASAAATPSGGLAR